MKRERSGRFDVAALRALVGAKVFARGEEYFADGAVQILTVEKDRVLAQVEGSEDYRTRLSGRGKHIGGDCSCPAYDDWGSCKHMVAVALAVNAQAGDAEAEGSGTLSRIRAHLKAKGVDALVDLLIDLAERDPALLRKLDTAATAARGDDKTLAARLRKAIDQATRPRRFIEYDEAEDWADNVGVALDALAELAPAGQAGLVLELAMRAIDRLGVAAESIDDSDGHVGALLERARDIHLAAAAIVRPEPVALARALYAREVDGGEETFAGAASVYGKVLGKTGLTEYRRLANEAWDRLPPRPRGAARVDADDFVERLRLMGILDHFAERDGDVDRRIALRARDLSTPWAYFQLAEFCLSQKRRDEALSHAEEGLWRFEDERTDERLLFFAVDLLTKAGREKDALAHLWRAFEKQPDLDLYARLRKLGGVDARGRALELLERRLAKTQRSAWSWPADLLIRVRTREKMFDTAWAAVRAHGASMDAKMELARASDAARPGEALAVYVEHVTKLVEAGGNDAYKTAAALVARMAALRDAAEQAAYVAALKQRFARRRNFIAMLR